ncbi:MAG TPA: BON domain-containing protein [Bryobacteraceae bacterium]
MRNALLYVTVVLIAFLSHAPQAAAAAQKSVSKTDSDREIQQKIQAKLAKSKLAADHFTVSVSHGIATIEGNTDIAQHKGVMTRMVKAAGATAVSNNIRVSAAGKAKATEAFANARSKSRKDPVPASPSKLTQVPHARVLPVN